MPIINFPSQFITSGFPLAPGSGGRTSACGSSLYTSESYFWLLEFLLKTSKGKSKLTLLRFLSLGGGVNLLLGLGLASPLS